MALAPWRGDWKISRIKFLTGSLFRVSGNAVGRLEDLQE